MNVINLEHGFTQNYLHFRLPPVDLGSLAIGGKMMQYVGGPLSGEHFIQIEE
jgi:hypothetical protein